MGFYDAKGHWRSDGEGFYDGKGNWVSPGDAFYDGRGQLRIPGEGFYDGKGNWVSPGEAFYDGKGHRQSPVPVAVVGAEGGAEIVGAVGLLLSLPIIVLWSMTMVLVDWMASHLYLIFAGYLFLNAIICIVITKRERHRGVGAVLSFTGNYVCMLSFVYIVLVYALPYVKLNEGSIGSFFEFTLTLAMGAGGIAIVQFFNAYHGRAVLECILGVLFFVVIIVMLKYGNEVDTVEALAGIYGVEASKLFVTLFGLAY